MNPATPCLIFNPSARGEKARRIKSHLDILRGQCVLLATAAAGDARRLASQAVKNGYHTVIAVGGDGTANEVVNGIADVPGGLKTTRLGVLPMGTVNVFARELGMSMNLMRAWKTLAAGNERTIDLGRAEFTLDGKRESRVFLQLGGAGLDSRAIELTHWEVKKKIGPLAYLVAGINALREDKPIVTVQSDPPASGELVLFGNGRYYGGPIPIFPRARLDDGLLDVCVIPKVTFPRFAAAVFGLMVGRLHKACGAIESSTKMVKLTSSTRVILELDGENVGELPATLTVEPKCLRIIVPQAV